MSLSRKYSRTLHYPFSPGTTNDDRIQSNYWEAISQNALVIHTEKLDGENTCLNQYGVFARSHIAPTRHPWAAYLKERWQSIKNELGDLELFGENLYAIHSIRYQKIEQHFYLFAIRYLDQWLSWEEVKFYAALLDFPTVPELALEKPTDKNDFEAKLLQLATQASVFDSIDCQTQLPCQREGIVTRAYTGFPVEQFSHQVLKYVRANHVKTDVHWTRNWQRAPLVWEKIY